jgi:hypothetical protein
MKIKGLTEQQLIQCAREAGAFRLDNMRSEGNYTLFVLRMANGTPTERERKWFDQAHTRKLSPSEEQTYRWIAERMLYRRRGISRMMWGRGPQYGTAVCFHGFKVFMDRVFDLNPKAIIRTSKAAYLGIDDFNAKWPSIGSQNVGSQMCPVQYEECCDCYGG